MFVCHSNLPIHPVPSFSSRCPYIYSLHLCLYFCFANKIIYIPHILVNIQVCFLLKGLLFKRSHRLPFPVLFLKKLICLFSFLLYWVFLAARALSPRASHCGGFSCQERRTDSGVNRLQQLQRVGSIVVAWGLQNTGSVVTVPGLSCWAAGGICPEQGSNPCPLHWQLDS